MNVLVLGSGGREHTLVWKIIQSPKVDKILYLSGIIELKDQAHLVPQRPRRNLTKAEF